MPIEIRELIIKTEITTGARGQGPGIKDRELVFLKKQLLDACKRLISESTKKSSYTR